MQKYGHRHILKKYFLFAENQLSEAESKQIEEHIKSCKPCSSTWQRLDRMKVTEEQQVTNRVPDTICQEIIIQLDSQENQHQNFTFHPSVVRFAQVCTIFIFVVLAFSIGYILADFPQSSSLTDELTNSTLQQLYFESVHVEKLSNFPAQTIVQSVKNIGVLEGLEGK